MTSVQLNTPVHLQYNVILIGKTGSGKSASGNTILQKQSFISKKCLKTVTQKVEKETVTFEGVTLNVYDTPGLFDPERNNEDIMEKLQPLLQLDPTVPTVFLLVMKADRFTPEERQTIELVEEWFPETLHQNIWILFTRGDELQRENITIEEFIADTEELETVLQRFNNRYHVFNNITKDPDQVRRLIEKIKNTPLCTAEDQHMKRTKPTNPEKDPLQRRIVLLGKTGAGKSAAGNTILGEERFTSELSSRSVTKWSEIQQAVVAERSVSVVDTPGLFDTEMSPEDLAVQIGMSVYLSSPGPHAFLYVQPINIRFTEQEKDVVQKLEMIFGEEMRKFTIILFTHGDQLRGKNVEQIIKENKDLSSLVDQCGGYHVFNNEDKSNRKQVTELLEKIDRIVEKNGGTCYSNELYEDAQRCRQEEEERMKKEEEEKRQKEEKQRQEEMERVRREIEKRMREEMERVRREIEKRMREEERRRREREERMREDERRRRETQEKTCSIS